MRVKELDQGDVFFIFVLCLIVFGMAFVWYLPLPMVLQAIFTITLGVSMYYQFMVWYRQSTIPMLEHDIEDRIINELAYQTIKRGYTFTVNREPLDPDDFDSDYKLKIDTNLPKGKKKVVKFISLLNIMLNPAWKYREFDEEDDIWGDES